MIKMEVIVRVDKQGRRSEGCQGNPWKSGRQDVVCRIIGSGIILEKFAVDLIDRAFAEPEEVAPSLELD